LKIENLPLKNSQTDLTRRFFVSSRTLNFQFSIFNFQFSICLFTIAACLLCPVSGCQQPPPDDDLYPVGDFALTERSGQTIRQADLLGKVWVASFIFTRCGSTCPQITDMMTDIQDDLADQEDVMLVTISVDPSHDRPEVLREYAARYRADPKRWLFLTGDTAAVYRLILEGFRLTARQNEGAERTPGNEVMHSNQVAIVDRRGHIRGYIDATEPDGVKRVEDKVRGLLREKS
jgi:cytochrome oxidase Cu insertion factor (SCO1/SenC/PrrC family)